jgi:5-hydroxyisourate hydrolase-like protein (transthyretin family)
MEMGEAALELSSKATSALEGQLLLQIRVKLFAEMGSVPTSIPPSEMMATLFQAMGEVPVEMSNQVTNAPPALSQLLTLELSCEEMVDDSEQGEMTATTLTETDAAPLVQLNLDLVALEGQQQRKIHEWKTAEMERILEAMNEMTETSLMVMGEVAHAKSRLERRVREAQAQLLTFASIKS